MRDIVIIFAVLLLLLVLISTLGGSIRYYNVPAPRYAFPESFAEQEKERDTFAEEAAAAPVPPTVEPSLDAEPEKDEALTASAAGQVEGFASSSSDYATV
jgi:Na+-transporting methylmalonyl-CoA/oxaloacetate decarboxylase gamma subunit